MFCDYMRCHDIGGHALCHWKCHPVFTRSTSSNKSARHDGVDLSSVNPLFFLWFFWSEIWLIPDIVNRLDIKALPYIIFMVVPVLGRMSDSNDEIRATASNTFAALVKMIPLEVSTTFSSSHVIHRTVSGWSTWSTRFLWWPLEKTGYRTWIFESIARWLKGGEVCLTRENQCRATEIPARRCQLARLSG